MSKEAVVPESMKSMTEEAESEEETEVGTPETVKNLRLRCLWDFVVIFPDTGKKYQGKIELLSEGTAGLHKTKFRGLVVAVGQKCEEVKKGDYVYFWKHAGSVQFIENKEFRVCRENEVYAIDERSQEEIDADGKSKDADEHGDFEGQQRTNKDKEDVRVDQEQREKNKRVHLPDEGWG